MLTYLLSIALKAACLILGISTPGGFPPPLDAEEEKRLFEAFFETGDEKAREKLILHNLRLVSHISRMRCSKFFTFTLRKRYFSLNKF